jgi:hypothetical protein
MTTIVLLVTLALGCLVALLAGDVRPAGKIPRIGILHPGSPPSEAVLAFQHTLPSRSTRPARGIPISAGGSGGRRRWPRPR